MEPVNQIIVVGRLVRDPIIRSDTAGKMVALFTLVTNHQYRSKAGEFAQEAAFTPCIAFSRAAEMLSHRMKGEPVLVVGQLRTDTWEQDDERRNQLTLVCDSVRCFAVPSVGPPGPEEQTQPSVMEMPEK
jgi:single-strand DNA-binding protein